MDRYSITKGMYNLFDHCIQVPNLADRPVFYHEYYHHFQNVTTVLGAERLNLLIQFLAHTTILARNHDPLFVPFNRWFEQGQQQGFEDKELQTRLENLVYHQDLWMYLDKINYPLYFFDADADRLDEYIATRSNADGDALEPYILRQEFGVLVGYPIGGYAITESGAYALELWHAQRFDPAILQSINEQNYPYLIVLDLLYRLIEDFRLACLATFLLCDLAMIISTPSMGFLLAYQTAKMHFNKGISESALLRWYRAAHFVHREEIMESVRLEMTIVQEIRDRKKGLNKIIDHMIEWQLGLMEKGLHLRLEHTFEFLERLISGKEEDLKLLRAEFPPSVILTTDDGLVHFDQTSDFDNYELLNASFHLYLGLCRNVEHLFDRKDLIHLERIDQHRFQFNLARDGHKSDAYGYLLHTLGLVDRTINILNTEKN